MTVLFRTSKRFKMALDIPNHKEIFGQGDVRETPSSTQTQTQTNLAPIGAILPWLKSFTNTPALISGWVECDGSVLSDVDSVYNGQTLPDLNGGEFLRGDATSGGTGGSDTMAHTHGVTTNVTVGNHTALTMSNHNAIVIANHSSLTMSNHTIGGTAITEDQMPAHIHDVTIWGDIPDKNSGHILGGDPTQGTPDVSTTSTGGGSTHTHTIGAHSFSQNISAHSISTNIDAHSFSQNISNHSVTNNGVTSDAASNDENRPKFYNVVWIMRVK